MATTVDWPRLIAAPTRSSISSASIRPAHWSAYRGDDSLRARIEELASKSTEGELTDSERAEYEGYIQANKFIAILQAKAKKLLDNGQTA